MNCSKLAKSNLMRQCLLVLVKICKIFICLLINPSPNKPWFLLVCRTSLLKTLWEKERLLEQSLLFPPYFLPIWITFCYFHQIYYCCLQTLSIWKRLKFDIWESVNLTHYQTTSFRLFQTERVCRRQFQI